MTNVRVRLAPSPTGELHVGTARTALFNELFARKEGGTFIIRIEDTDKARSKPEYENNIKEGLAWLGITWDEGPDKDEKLDIKKYGPYRQSERTEIYQEEIKKLLAADKAYIDEKSNNVIRLRVNPQEIVFQDLVRGEIKTHSDSWGGDFVIARSLTDPVFHLAVVVDDAAQEITHVIRGEDHISNTARHILIQRALNVPTPQYAHLPLLLDDQRRKLSKRAGDVSLLAYRDKGYLPEAMLNYLALLGWNPKDDSEFFSHEELVNKFSLDGIQKGGAIFSLIKLNAINKHYLRQLPENKMLELTKPFLAPLGMTIEETNQAYWTEALLTEQSRSSTLIELAESVQFFRDDWPADYSATLLLWKEATAQETQEKLLWCKTVLEQASDSDFTKPNMYAYLMSKIDDNNLDRGATLWPLRVALTGLKNSPSPFDVAQVLGREKTLSRIDIAYTKLTNL